MQSGFFTYLVGWDDTLDIKAGVTTHPRRWESFLRRGAHLYQLHAADTNDRYNLCGLESSLLAWLDSCDLVSNAFHYREQAQGQLGSRGAGYTECFHAWCRAFYVDALAACVRIMREHPTGQCGTDVRALMHGRTHGRTYGDHQSPTRPPLVSDARAHIQEMDVDEVGNR